jgi:hypothetical protein
LVSFPGTPVPGSGFFRPFRDWFAEKICPHSVPHSVVSKSQVATIRQYVVNQKDHHCRMDFAKEFELLANKHGFEIGIDVKQQVGCGVP